MKENTLKSGPPMELISLFYPQDPIQLRVYKTMMTTRFAGATLLMDGSR